MAVFKYTSTSERQTRVFAKRLGRLLAQNDCLALLGHFGSGKTTFVKGLAEGAGCKKKDYVASPSFVILKIYHGRRPLYHFDLYRLKREHDADSVGLYEFVYEGGGISVIEWAEKVLEFLPDERLEVRFFVRGPEKRELNFRTSSRRLAGCIKRALGPRVC